MTAHGDAGLISFPLCKRRRAQLRIQVRDMDAGTVFATVSVTMLVNGLALGLIYRDLPSELRPSAVYWLVGTLLIALGCTGFAFGGPLPRPLMLTMANGVSGSRVLMRATTCS